MPPIDTSALAAIFAWVWGQYGKTITDKTIKAAWERLRWEDRALAYGQKVQRLYGTMQILGQPKPVSLEGIYTAISLLDRPTAWQRYTLEEMREDFAGRSSHYLHASDKEKRRDGLAMVKGGENLFILGKPGAGKTTFLKHMALRGVRGDLKRVPIFVGLKQLSDSGLSVFDFVVNEFDVCDFPDAKAYLDRLLKAGKAILLFDGLDEVNVAEDERKSLIGDVETFTRKYDQCQRLITCRLAANDYVFQGYAIVEMADFNEAQIRGFVAQWFRGDRARRERRELFLSELNKSENEGLRELARVPLLLAMVCLAFEDTGKVSTRRVELYRDVFEALLKRWDDSQGKRRDEVTRYLSVKRKRKMLAEIAFETFEAGEFFIPRHMLARQLEAYLSRELDVTIEEVDGEEILKALIAHHGLFLEQVRDVYSFAHLTVQEYFVARYVVENESPEILLRLIEQYADPRYHEVFLLAAAQLQDATRFFKLFIEHLAKELLTCSTGVSLLRWSTRKATMVRDSREMTVAAMRSFYLSLTLDLTRTLVFDYDIDIEQFYDDNFDDIIEGAYELTLDPEFYIDNDFEPDSDLAWDEAIESVFAGVLDDTYDDALDLALDRSLIMDFNLDLSFSLNHRLSLDHNFAHILDLDYARVIARDLNLGRALKEPLDLAIYFEHALEPDLSRTAEHAGELARNKYYVPAFDAALINAKLFLVVGINLQENQLAGSSHWIHGSVKFITAAAAQIARMGETEQAVEMNALAKRLSETVAGSDISRELSDLDAIIEKYSLNFPLLYDDNDRKVLSKYLFGNLLLLECLEEANVADREAIKDRLLLLPEA